jgi:Flp pilus assembly protein TadB
MKKKTPSNPLPPAESLNLSLNAGAAQQQPSQNNAEPKPPPNGKTRRKATKARRAGSRASRDDTESRWNRIKGRLAAKVAQVDKENLKVVLLACGVAVGIVASVVFALKLLPLAVLILAILGLGLALRLWERLRYLPRPF